jgi:nitrite reductase/ring-hydroxylating ferredoxin subunit
MEQQVARVEEVPHGSSKKFILSCKGRQIEGFVVNYHGSFYAYRNRCCHIPMPMDWFENQFLSEDGRYIICATHGATYDPETGECVAGPCPGEYLERLPLQILNGTIFVVWAPGDLSEAATVRKGELEHGDEGRAR